MSNSAAETDNGDQDSLSRVHRRIDELALKMQEAEADRDKATLKAIIKYLLIALTVTSGFSLYCIRLIQNAAIKWS